MKNEIVIQPGNIANHIRVLRGEKVMLDNILAQFYQVEVKSLKRSVKRNISGCSW